MKLDLEMDSDILSGGHLSSGSDLNQGTHSNVRIGRDSVLVAGGMKNPFFVTGGRVLTEKEFDTWKKLYKDALVQSGLGPVLTRRYPDIS